MRPETAANTCNLASWRKSIPARETKIKLLVFAEHALFTIYCKAWPATTASAPISATPAYCARWDFRSSADPDITVIPDIAVSVPGPRL